MTKIQISKKLRGFSLVEIIVVLAIIGLLVGIAIPAILAAQRSARQTAQETVMNNIRMAYSSNFTKTSTNSHFHVSSNNSCPTNTQSKTAGVYQGVGNGNISPNQVYFVVSAPGSGTSPVECVRLENKTQFNIQRIFNSTGSTACISNTSYRSDLSTVRFIDSGTSLFYCNEDGKSVEFTYRS